MHLAAPWCTCMSLHNNHVISCEMMMMWYEIVVSYVLVLNNENNYYYYYLSVRGCVVVSIRPYQYECTRNHQNSEVKRAWASLVLGWGTTREPLVLYAFLLFIFKFTIFQQMHMHMHYYVYCHARTEGSCLLVFFIMPCHAPGSTMMHMHVTS